MRNKRTNVQTAAWQKKTLHKNLSFTAAEAYKLLRTNVLFALPGEDEKKCRIIGVTSSVRGEGKSTTSINLAYVLGEMGKKVLLIEGDMRLPSFSVKMDIRNSPDFPTFSWRPEARRELRFIRREFSRTGRSLRRETFRPIPASFSAPKECVRF